MDLIISPNGYSDYKRNTIDENYGNDEDVAQENSAIPSAL
jgi:hypothetical protein